MSSSKKNNDNIVLQASILAAAGIISRMIGLLYRSPLHRIIGDLGMGYYQSAYAYYTIVLLISSYSIPSAISKIIAQKLAVKEYNNAHRIFRCALAYVLVIGGIGSAFLYFGAGLFVEEAAIPVLHVFAPTILVYGILGVLRGYFQAHRSMVQTSVSQIIEQIVNAIVSVGAAYLMIKYAMGRAADVLANGAAGAGTTAVANGMADATENARAIWGAMGSATGTGMGVVSALLFMLLAYGLNRSYIKKRVKKDKRHKVDSYPEILKSITLIVTPFILSTAIYNLSSSINTKIFTDFYPHVKGLDVIHITTQWGIFSGQALTISNIPIAFASAMAAAMIPSVSTLMASKDLAGARDKIHLATKTTMMISIPCAFGLYFLAAPITNLLFHNSPEVLAFAGRLLMTLALSVIFYALSTLNSSILQGIGKVNTPIVNAGISLVIQTAVACGLLFYTNLGVYSIALANTVYSGMMCFLNQFCVRRAINYRQEYKTSFIIPLISSAVMGLFAKVFYEGLLMITGSMKLAVIPSVAAAAFVYFLMMVKLKGITEAELRAMPKGTLIIRVAKKCKVL